MVSHTFVGHHDDTTGRMVHSPTLLTGANRLGVTKIRQVRHSPFEDGRSVLLGSSN